MKKNKNNSANVSAKINEELNNTEWNNYEWLYLLAYGPKDDNYSRFIKKNGNDPKTLFLAVDTGILPGHSFMYPILNPEDSRVVNLALDEFISEGIEDDVWMSSFVIKVTPELREQLQGNKK